MNYDKYLKYKKKYILLKENLSQIGGTYNRLGAGNYGVVFENTEEPDYVYKVFILNEQQNSRNYDNELSTLHYITRNKLQNIISSPHIIKLSIFDNQFNLVKPKNYAGKLSEYKKYTPLKNPKDIQQFIKTNTPYIISELTEEVKKTINYVVIKMPKYKMTLYKYLKELAKNQNDDILITQYKKIIDIILNKINIMIKNNIYHFDIKSDNIMVNQNNSNPTFKIIDFGKSGVITNPENSIITEYLEKYYLLYYISEYNTDKNVENDKIYIEFQSPGPSLIYSDKFTTQLTFNYNYEPKYLTYYKKNVKITKKEILKNYIISYFLNDILDNIFIIIFKSKRFNIVDELLNKYHEQLMSNINSFPFFKLK